MPPPVSTLARHPTCKTHQDVIQAVFEGPSKAVFTSPEDAGAPAGARCQISPWGCFSTKREAHNESVKVKQVVLSSGPIQNW